MKTSNVTVTSLVVLLAAVISTNFPHAQTATSPAQGSNGSQPTPPAATPYTVVFQDANSQVWQQEALAQAPDGSVVTNIHKYTELATGLNHWVNGQSVASSEQIGVSPDGSSAAATNGQHQVYFPGNIYNGVIQLVTPDGKTLRSQPIGLSFDDGNKSVLIALLTNSTGAILPSGNQVIYQNAFTCFDADLLYAYTKAGFEQDVIIRTEPPTPESLGLNPATAKLQILTEFFNPPTPTTSTTTLPAQAGVSLTDESLDFGVMKIGIGRAFMIGTNASAGNVLVGKQWVQVGGRQILVEEVPVEALANQLGTLPLSQGASTKTGTAVHPVASRHWQLPPPHLTQVGAAGRFKRMAAATSPKQGLVLDYQTINSSLTNYTFQGDTTYFVSGAVNLYGTNNILEGGAVLKYATNNSAGISMGSGATLNCLTAPYRPAILTAKDDNSVGQTISGSTGNPTNYYGSQGLSIATPTSLHDLRLACLNTGIYNNNVNNSNCNLQFINCDYSVVYVGSPVIRLENVLVQGGAYAISNGSGSGSILYENCTLHNVGDLGGNSAMTNCLVVGVANTNYSIADVSNVFLNRDAGVFQSVGAGANYLATNSPYHNAGTTNIDTALLAELAAKTTYPPIVCSNVTFSVATNFSPQVPRDTNGAPDLGYHYDPLDYIFSNVTLSATLTLANGVAVGVSGSYGLDLQTGAQVYSQGLAQQLNQVVSCQNVQEQPLALGGNTFLKPEGTWPQLGFRFTDFSIGQGTPGTLLSATLPTTDFIGLTLRDCRLRAATLSAVANIGNSTNATVALTNNLLERCSLTFKNSPTIAPTDAHMAVNLLNNLFWRGSLAPTYHGGGPNSIWQLYDNLFDGATETIQLQNVATNGGVLSSYNGYTAGTTDPFEGEDLTGFQPDYQTGPLGSYYYPTNGGNLSQLIKAGSTTADRLGLYHYTVTTNQVIEGTKIVSIGYHYAATDSYGNPLDTNGDGIPDYLEDTNGDGIFDAGDLSDWQMSPFGLGGLNALQVFTPLK